MHKIWSEYGCMEIFAYHVQYISFLLALICYNASLQINIVPHCKDWSIFCFDLADDLVPCKIKFAKTRLGFVTQKRHSSPGMIAWRTRKNVCVGARKPHDSKKCCIIWKKKNKKRQSIDKSKLPCKYDYLKSSDSFQGKRLLKFENITVQNF